MNHKTYENENVFKVADSLLRSTTVKRIEPCLPQHKQFKDWVRSEYKNGNAKVRFQKNVRAFININIPGQKSAI